MTFLLNFSRKLFFNKNDVETLFSSSENRLQNRGAHYTRVNTVYVYVCMYLSISISLYLCLSLSLSLCPSPSLSLSLSLSVSVSLPLCLSLYLSLAGFSKRLSTVLSPVSRVPPSPNFPVSSSYKNRNHLNIQTTVWTF